MPRSELNLCLKVPKDLGRDQLFHYTDAGGLLGIIKSESIWAFDIRSLNDEQEYFYGLDLAKAQMTRIAEVQTDKSAQIRALWLLDRLGSISEGLHVPTYVASFSQAPDLLSQWRAYGDGGGFSLGFNLASLQELAKDQGFNLAPCIYDPDAQNKQIAEVLTARAMPWVRSGDPTPLREHNHGGYPIESQIHQDLHGILPLLKHPGFSEEREWRLILSLPGAGVMNNNLHRLEFRDRGRHLAAYSTFNLSSDSAQAWTRMSIVIGPSLRQSQQAKTLNMLLRAKLGGLCVVYCSDIPLREG